MPPSLATKPDYYAGRTHPRQQSKSATGSVVVPVAVAAALSSSVSANLTDDGENVANDVQDRTYEPLDCQPASDEQSGYNENFHALPPLS